MFRSIPAIGYWSRSFTVRTMSVMCSPMSWAKTGRPVWFSAMERTMCFSGRDWAWTRKKFREEIVRGAVVRHDPHEGQVGDVLHGSKRG